LLSPNERARVLAARGVTSVAFQANANAERELVRELPSLLDRIDAWIAAGVLDGPELNVADFVIAPSLALIAYRLDLRADVEARPAGALMERVLPEPALPV
jgi:hypothetical protein